MARIDQSDKIHCRLSIVERQSISRELDFKCLVISLLTFIEHHSDLSLVQLSTEITS